MMKKLIALISNKITSITHAFGFLAIAVGTLLLIYDARYLLSFGGGWDYINNIIVEAHGLFFDLLILGVLITIYERKKQKKEAIEREKNLIDDFRKWNEKEATFRIMGSVKRLNSMGIFEIDFSKCFLKSIEVQHGNFLKSKFLSTNLQWARFYWTNLSEVAFKWSDLEGAMFIESNLVNGNFEYATLKGTNFGGSDLSFSNFKLVRVMDWVNFENANLEGSNFQRVQATNVKFSNTNLKNVNLIEASFRDSFFEDVELENASVGLGWFEKLQSWNIEGLEELIAKYIIDENGVIKLK